MFKTFRTNNQAHLKDTEDDVFSRLLARLQISHGVDYDDEELAQAMTEKDDASKEAAIVESKSTAHPNRSTSAVKEPKSKSAGVID
jgi:hypothetical protein